LFLKYLDRHKLLQVLEKEGEAEFRYPAAGIKGAKELANNLQKLFNDYQKVYTENYNQIKQFYRMPKSWAKM